MKSLFGNRGFSAIEMVTALVAVGIVTSIGMSSYNNYVRKTSARRAAEVFAADLALARGTAIRGRQNVAVSFDESGLQYVATTAGGDTVFVRGFGPGDELRLDAIDLEFTGNSVTFNSRGFADLSGSLGTLGRATFRRGTDTYATSFNALGTAKVGS